jgi:solute carrier family 25 oxoglutarate transporter 11
MVASRLATSLLDGLLAAALGLQPSAPLARRLVGRLTAAAAAGALACPLEVCLVRMQGDAVLPPAQQRAYRGVHDALRRIGGQEGLAPLWAAALATAARAALQSAAATLALAAGALPHGRGAEAAALRWLLPLGCRLAGVLLWLPLDAVKSRTQHQLGVAARARPAPGGIGQSAREIVATSPDGVAALFRGLLPAFVAVEAAEALRLLFAASERAAAHGGRRAQPRHGSLYPR